MVGWGGVPVWLGGMAGPCMRTPSHEQTMTDTTENITLTATNGNSLRDSRVMFCRAWLEAVDDELVARICNRLSMIIGLHIEHNETALKSNGTFHNRPFDTEPLQVHFNSIQGTIATTIANGGSRISQGALTPVRGAKT